MLLVALASILNELLYFLFVARKKNFESIVYWLLHCLITREERSKRDADFFVTKRQCIDGTRICSKVIALKRYLSCASCKIMDRAVPEHVQHSVRGSATAPAPTYWFPRTDEVSYRDTDAGCDSCGWLESNLLESVGNRGEYGGTAPLDITDQSFC